MDPSPLIYREFAKYYELIYSFKNYQNEAKLILTLINQFKQSHGNKLLDVACGTGNHLSFLKEHFNCMGVDLNEPMLEIAKSKHPDINFEQVNMIDMRLNKKFDIITCLFATIGYVKTLENFQKTLETFALHLEPGGIVIIEPWFTKENYLVGEPWMHNYDSPDIKIARVGIPKLEKNISIMDMYFLLAEKDGEVKTFSERHELGIFEMPEILEIMGNIGFDACHLGKPAWEKERGIYVGVYKTN